MPSYHQSSPSQKRTTDRRNNHHAQHSQPNLTDCNCRRRPLRIPRRTRPTPRCATGTSSLTWRPRRSSTIIRIAHDIAWPSSVLHEARLQLANRLLDAQTVVSAGAVEFLDGCGFAAFGEDVGGVGGYAADAADGAGGVARWELGEVCLSAGCCAGAGARGAGCGGGCEGHFFVARISECGVRYLVWGLKGMVC